MNGGLLMVRSIACGPPCLEIFTQLSTWKFPTLDQNPFLPSSTSQTAIGLCLKSAFVMMVYALMFFLPPIFQFWKLDVILQNVFNRLAGQSFPL
jgi:hypothetical protein